jgi:molybdopterin guanine dinucleotide-containing S/N-oxide reductase-like protein
MMIQKRNSEKRNDPNKKIEQEQSSVIGLGFCGPGAGSNTSVTEIKNGKIVRIRPLHFDWKYDKELFKPWKMEARGKSFEPRLKSLIPPFSLAYKKRVYSPNRILYPMKRVDWDPNGERNPQNRGKSKYVRISWDEATDIIVSEIKRIQKQYGVYAILPQWGGHGETKSVHNPHGYPNGLLALMGGFTMEMRNPDSWEGWHWGAMHCWGMPPVGQMDPSTNCMMDVARNSDMLLFWGCDPETTPWGVDGMTPTRLSFWFKELGIQSIYICPDLNYGAAIHADKWIPIRPGTDAALQLAVAYIWMTEGTYDKEYVKTHTFGYEKFEEYVLGKEDGVPKTAEWAAAKCGIPEWTIKALAREWGTKVTSIAHGNGGPGIRSAYSTENGRLEILLLAMQGLGKAGTHQVKMIEWWHHAMSHQNPMPLGKVYTNTMAAQASMPSLRRFGNKEQQQPMDDKKDDGADMPGLPTRQKQVIPKDLVHDALLKGDKPLTWYGTSFIAAPMDDQFRKYTFPVEGGSEIHMIWTDGPCWITCWNDSNSFIKGLRSPKLEFVMAQHPWLENDCLFCDIILPVSTKFEEEDIDNDNHSGQFNMLSYQKQCIEPLGESKSDFEIVCLLAEKLGLLQDFTGGRSVDQMIKDGFDRSGIKDMTTFEEFKEKGYFVVPPDPDWEKYPAGLYNFYKDPDNNKLLTPSGKIEFFSQNLFKHFPDDKERPPVPHWIEKGESHDERVSSIRAKKYPLLLVSNHGHWRVHANCDDITWTREAPTCKVKGPDGYLYEPVWMNPEDAAARGIKNGDIVKLSNERGAVLTGAYVSERIMAGAVSVDHGARYDAIIPGELDRGGAINTITPHKNTSKNATGMVVSSFLVEAEKVTLAQMDEWKKQYPDAFEREYDPAQGLCMSAWIDGVK